MNCYVIPGIKTAEEIVSESFGIKTEEMFQKTRVRDICEARQFLFWFKRNKQKWHFNSIGRAYGFNHATVIHACTVVDNLMETDKFFKHKANEALEKLETLTHGIHTVGL